MTIAKVKGQIKESTGKLTGDTGMRVEGTLEKGVAQVKGAVVYVTDTIAAGASTVASAIGDVLNAVKKTISKLF